MKDSRLQLTVPRRTFECRNSSIHPCTEILALHRLIRHTVLVTMCLALSVEAFSANPKPTTTVMTVGEMCGGCVRSITAKLETVPGVAKVSCDVTSKSVTVTHAAGKTLTAQTLWAAREEISKTPKKLVGPEGTFTSKPKG